MDDQGTSGGMMLSFDLVAWATGGNTTSAAILRVGTGYDAGYFAPSNENTFTRLGINLVSQPVEGFQLRDIGAGVNSAVFEGIQPILWVMNPEQAAWTYWGPDGTERSLAPFRADVWVGPQLVFEDMAALSAVPLNDIKLHFPSGLGTIRFDNVMVEGSPQAPLPLLFSSVGCVDGVIGWKVDGEPAGAEHFLLEGVVEGRHVDRMGSIPFQQGKEAYVFSSPGVLACQALFRIRLMDTQGESVGMTNWFPNCCRDAERPPVPYPIPAGDRVFFLTGGNGEEADPLEAWLVRPGGQVVLRSKVEPGGAGIGLEAVPPGIYHLIWVGVGNTGCRFCLERSQAEVR
jgi:hypothetical protein